MADGLRLFGVPEFGPEGKRRPLPVERRGQLLAYLALRRTWVPRGEVAALLWPEQQTHLALANLRKTLFRLAALDWPLAVQTQGGAIRLDAGTDVEAFEAALREHRLGDALALRRGEFLVGFDDDANPAWTGWLGFERDRLRVAWRAAALERLDGEVEAAEAIELSAQLLESDPLDEAALRQHMRWLAQHGQAGRARQVYRDFAQRMQHELGLAPGAELKAQHDALGSAAVLPRVEMPHGDDGFIGRSMELRRIAEILVQPGCRLLTLVGPGGVGKTRLARRAMAELAGHHAHGAVFVALEDVVSAPAWTARLAREVGVARLGSRDALDASIETLAQRQTLLVLDNFEQLAAEAAAIERLLAGCPRLAVLVTSRVRLALPSESVLPIEGLPAPEAEDRDRLEAFDATRLFIAAARRVQPALAPAAEADAIVEICRRLEGLPLALELAAAWTRVLSCADIVAELRRGTELLRAADAAHPPRHASIELVFEQSWALLGAAERDTLARLSVFRGGLTAESARAVANAALPVLGALVDKSLLRKDGARLQMHPLVQKLAAARLDDAARATAREAHGRHFLRMLAQSRRGARLSDRDTLRAIDADVENCRSAWRWAVAHGEAEALRQVAWTLLHYCNLRGHFAEGLGLLRHAIDAWPGERDPALDVVLLAAVAHLEGRLDRYDEAQATALRALAGVREGEDHDAAAQAHKALASCAMRRDRIAEARHHWREALRLSPGDARTAAAMLDNMSTAENLLGRKDAALRMAMQALVQHRAIGDASGEAFSLNQIGTVQNELGQFDAARTHLDAALALCDRQGLAGFRVFVLASLNVNAFDAGDLDAAQAFGERALDAARAVHNRLAESAIHFQFARIAARRRQPERARAELRAGFDISLAIGSPELGYIGIAAFADLLEAQGEAASARRVLAFVAALPSVSARLRHEFGARLANWGSPPDGAAWPGLGADELLHRIVVETDVGHAPLIALLRGG